MFEGKTNMDGIGGRFLCCFSSPISVPLSEVDCLSKGGRVRDGGEKEGREEV